MSDEATTTRKPRQGGNPLDFVMDDIIEKIIKPKVDELISTCEFEGKTAFARAFRENTGCTASNATIIDWVEKCGYKFNRSVNISKE